MELYNSWAKCPKCGCEKIIDVFRHKGELFYDTSRDHHYNHFAEQDLIQRTCRNCSFSWHELPLDAQRPTGKGI